MSERTQKFVDYIIQQVQDNKGKAAALRRADNPNTEYQSWEVLAGFGVQLDSENQRLPFATIAADIARVKPLTNGNIIIGQAIARCYEDGNQSDQANEVFFVFEGSILLNGDLSDELEMESILKHD